MTALIPTNPDQILCNTQQYDRSDYATNLLQNYVQRGTWDVADSRKGGTSVSKWILSNIHSFLTGIPEDESLIRCMDFGCGPSIINATLASGRFDEIYLADYADCNIKALDDWWKNKETAFDWSTILAQSLPMLNLSSRDICKDKIQSLRTNVKGVHKGDFLADPMMDPKAIPEEGFDLIMSTLCMECAVNSKEEMDRGVEKMVQLLRKGGYLLQVIVEESYYTVGGKRIKTMRVTDELLRGCYRKAGLEFVQFAKLYTPLPDVDPKLITCDSTSWTATLARKI